MVFRDFIEEVRGATDIVSVIGADLELRPAERTLKGLSPFHPEKTPSFVVWPHNQSWYDFSNGGGLGGDVFAYVQQRDQVGFKEALLTLAERNGIRRPDQDDEAFRRELELLVERRDVERLLTQAASYYHSVLPTKIREEWYRQHYGFTDETIDELQLGWACGHLFEHFTDELKVEPNLALKTGLFVLVNGGRVEDFFRDRVVFPYWKGGQVVYFIARSTQFTGDEGWERSKYKKLLTHSERHGYVSETVRNETFYNEDSARGAEEVLITEGVTDCISAAQAGIACISPVTTRFRKQDVPKLLRLTRWAKRVVICNDTETSGAGAVGAEVTASALHAEGRDVRIAELPRPEGVDKVDVNEFLKANPPEAFREMLAGARRYLEHLIESIPADTLKIDLAAQLKPVMELIARRPAIEQDGYLDIITKRFKVGRRSVGAMLREARPEPAAKGAREDGDAGHGGEVLKGEVFEEQDHD
ncbi:MAG TPA: CHC2 zinc finger domain-containing protein [Thermoanaerobaculaceae bacterium]|nr:CHC2 zinc finger domain-containing protein [Thermoanaerobaculaceae bacterium]HRS15888.1 CHC2 zinc finger domain-containing protein [Thermoanaerobaculaceae bacterium]